MSTHPQSTNQMQTTTRTASPTPTFTTRDAPQTFDPYNTCPCPEMFADKWTSEE